MERGHVQLSALFRSVAAFLPDGRHEAVFGWGFNFAGATRLWGKDTIVYQAAYGNGIERYINDTSGLGEDAAVSSLQSPHIQALPVFATYASLQHFWKERLRSSAYYSFVQVKNTEAAWFRVPPRELRRRQPDLESLRFANGRRRILRMLSFHLAVKRPSRAVEELHQVAATRTERRLFVQVIPPL